MYKNMHLYEYIKRLHYSYSDVTYSLMELIVMLRVK